MSVFYDLNGGSLDPRGTEYRQIVSGSMDAGDTGYPIGTIPKGSMVSIRHLDQDSVRDIAVGDVVAYLRDGHTVVHRALENDPATGTLVLKGDANQLPETVAYEDVVGVVAGVSEQLGGLVSFAKSDPVLIIAGVACLAVLAYSVAEIAVYVYKKAST